MRDGKPEGILRTERSFFPSADPSLGPVSRFFEGEATSEVGLRAGLRRDVWSAVAPSVRDLSVQIKEGDRVFTGAKALPPAAARRRAGGGARRADALLRGQPAAGDLPADRLAAGDLDLDRRPDRLRGRPDRRSGRRPRRAPRPVAAAYAARVARELGRA